MKILLIEFNIQNCVYPLGLRYIVKYLEKFNNNLEINIKQFSYGKRFSYDVNKNLELKVLAYILEEKPDVVGFSSYIWSSEVISNLIRAIKINNPNIKTIIGGVELNINADFEADYLIQGEGEVGFKELIDYLNNKINIENVGSLVYKKDGEIVKNPIKIIDNLNDIPFPYDHSGELPSIMIESSRGCIFNCNYCYYAQKKVREFSLDYLKKGIKYLFENYEFENITFLDANFNTDEKRMFELLNYLEMNVNMNINNKNNQKLKVHLEFKPELINEKMIQRMEKYSFNILLELGLQSSNMDVLKKCGRPYNLEKIKENLKFLDKSNISYKIDLMYGLPKDSFMKFLGSVKFILNNALKQDNLRAHHFMLLNNTSFCNDKNLFRFNKNNSSMVIKTSTQNSIELYKTKLFIDMINKELRIY